MKILHLFMLLCIGLLVVYAKADDVAVPAEDVADVEDVEDDQPCMCPRNLDPVCASDKRTYPNLCEFECAQKKMVRRGRSIKLAHRGNC